MKRRSSRCLRLVPLIFLLCAAWGATGHKVVSQIAYDHLTPAARGQVDQLLAGATLPDFSVWPDQIKKDPTWAWTRPWHFADMPEGASEFKLNRDCPSDGCVVQGILRYSGVLRDPKAKQEDKVQALKFLAHYVGDVHQPLHVGHKADKGGNALQVQLFSTQHNLHEIWDDSLIKRRGMGWKVYASKLEEGLRPEDEKRWGGVTDPCAWATESNRLAVTKAYVGAAGKPIKSGDVLAQEYVDRNSPVVDEQLTKAGLRLAALLNDIYKDAPAPPSAPAAPPAVTPASNPPDAPADRKPAVKFVGSRRSEVYHLPGCADAKRISPENLVEYSDAPEGKRLHQGCPR
jgi:hypothetical protein